MDANDTDLLASLIADAVYRTLDTSRRRAFVKEAGHVPNAPRHGSFHVHHPAGHTTVTANNDLTRHHHSPGATPEKGHWVTIHGHATYIDDDGKFHFHGKDSPAADPHAGDFHARVATALASPAHGPDHSAVRSGLATASDPQPGPHGFTRTRHPREHQLTTHDALSGPGAPAVDSRYTGRGFVTTAGSDADPQTGAIGVVSGSSEVFPDATRDQANQRAREALVAGHARVLAQYAAHHQATIAGNADQSTDASTTAWHAGHDAAHPLDPLPPGNMPAAVSRRAAAAAAAGAGSPPLAPSAPVVPIAAPPPVAPVSPVTLPRQAGQTIPIVTDRALAGIPMRVNTPGNASVRITSGDVAGLVRRNPPHQAPEVDAPGRTVLVHDCVASGRRIVAAFTSQPSVIAGISRYEQSAPYAVTIHDPDGTPVARYESSPSDSPYQVSVVHGVAAQMANYERTLPAPSAPSSPAPVTLPPSSPAPGADADPANQYEESEEPGDVDDAEGQDDPDADDQAPVAGVSPQAAAPAAPVADQVSADTATQPAALAPDSAPATVTSSDPDWSSVFPQRLHEDDVATFVASSLPNMDRTNGDMYTGAAIRGAPFRVDGVPLPPRRSLLQLDDRETGMQTTGYATEPLVGPMGDLPRAPFRVDVRDRTGRRLTSLRLQSPVPTGEATSMVFGVANWARAHATATRGLAAKPDGTGVIPVPTAPSPAATPTVPPAAPSAAPTVMPAAPAPASTVPPAAPSVIPAATSAAPAPAPSVPAPSAQGTPPSGDPHDFDERTPAGYFAPIGQLLANTDPLWRATQPGNSPEIDLRSNVAFAFGTVPADQQHGRNLPPADGFLGTERRSPLGGGTDLITGNNNYLGQPVIQIESPSGLLTTAYFAQPASYPGGRVSGEYSITVQRPNAPRYAAIATYRSVTDGTIATNPSVADAIEHARRASSFVEGWAPVLGRLEAAMHARGLRERDWNASGGGAGRREAHEAIGQFPEFSVSVRQPVATIGGGIAGNPGVMGGLSLDAVTVGWTPRTQDWTLSAVSANPAATPVTTTMLRDQGFRVLSGYRMPTAWDEVTNRSLTNVPNTAVGREYVRAVAACLAYNHARVLAGGGPADMLPLPDGPTIGSNMTRHNAGLHAVEQMRAIRVGLPPPTVAPYVSRGNSLRPPPGMAPPRAVQGSPGQPVVIASGPRVIPPRPPRTGLVAPAPGYTPPSPAVPNTQPGPAAPAPASPPVGTVVPPFTLLQMNHEPDSTTHARVDGDVLPGGTPLRGTNGGGQVPQAPGTGVVQFTSHATGTRTVATLDDPLANPVATYGDRYEHQMTLRVFDRHGALLARGRGRSTFDTMRDAASRAAVWADQNLQTLAANAAAPPAATPSNHVRGAKPGDFDTRMADRDSVSAEWFGGTLHGGPPRVTIRGATSARRLEMEHRQFGRAIGDAEYGEMVGAVNGATVSVYLSASSTTADMDYIQITTDHPWYHNNRRFEFKTPQQLMRDFTYINTTTPPFTEGGLVCEQQIFQTKRGAPPKVAARIQASQVKKCMSLGVVALHVHGVGSRAQNLRGVRSTSTTDWSGYTVWPKLGFQAPFNDTHRSAARRLAAQQLAVSPNTAVTEPPNLDQITDFNTLHSTEQGRAWWEEYGSGGYWHFDLRPASLQRKILDQYLTDVNVNVGPDPY